jgi:hypothetical protein
MTSPDGELHVVPSHLRNLARRQYDAAADIADAAPLTSTEAEAVLRSHGIACRSTHLAAQAAALAKTRAGIAVQLMSEALAADLDSAAGKYTWTDQDSSGNIDGTMRPGHR